MASSVVPGWAGSVATVSFLIPTIGAVLTPSVAVPVQVAVPLAEVMTGPADANCVLGSAATTGTESPGEAAQSFFRAGASLAVALVVHVAVLPAPATMVVAAEADPAVITIIPPTANDATTADLAKDLIMGPPRDYRNWTLACPSRKRR